MNDLGCALFIRCNANDVTSMDYFMNLNDDRITSEILTDKEIVASVSK